MKENKYLEQKNETMGENSFMKKLLKKRLNQKGLTLIELLAVIVILAIVAAIAIPAIGTIIENSRIKSAKSDAALILNAANLADTENSDTVNGTPGPIDAEFLESQGNFVDYEVSQTDNAGPFILSGTWTNGVTIEFTDVTLDSLDTNSSELDTGMEIPE